MKYLFWAGLGLFLLAASGASAASSQEKQQPLVITSDRMEMDDQRHHAIFSGSVLVVEGAMRLTADSMTVVYKQDARQQGTTSAEVKEVRAEGKVRLEDGTHQGSAGRAVYDTQRRTLELQGRGKEPAFIQSEGQNRLEGDKIMLQLSAERRVEKVLAEGGEGGRVRARISPDDGADKEKPKKPSRSGSKKDE